ncbi:hypothetical protein LG52_3552 [Geobacillus kaustophilus]|uniref:Uncharacterized protein n=1 Tax=Geobacillus kaustophilus TaxID=1462 RepID=A0A0D8BT75_GEOKU|nr:hypothetical protein [Geobacillus kaustophilus]KJE26597.1 hypothetical protein LG52_3552 [Geobacillus kaustophilus]
MGGSSSIASAIAAAEVFGASLFPLMTATGSHGLLVALACWPACLRTKEAALRLANNIIVEGCYIVYAKAAVPDDFWLPVFGWRQKRREKE